MTPPKRTAKKAAKKAPAKKVAAKKAPAKKAPAKKVAAKKAPAKKVAAKKAPAKKAPAKKAAAAAAPMLISKSRTKDFLKGKGKRSGDDVIEALNAEVYALLEKASSRAEGNGRRTVRPTDF